MENKNTQLCPNCQTGKDDYLLDKQSPVCNYLSCHNGKECSKYVPIKQ